VELPNSELAAPPAEDDLRLVRGRTIPDLVAEQLRDAILSGKFRAGERLVEQKLGARFGIGQPTVREALRELELQGFVRKSPNRGTYVTEFTQEDIRKNLEVRMALETLAAEKAARNLTLDGAARLKALFQDMEASIAHFDRAAFHKADVAFHRKIWELSGNEYLCAALERVTFGLFAFMLVERTAHDAVMSHVADQHRGILQAILTRDPKLAREGYIRCTSDFWKQHHKVVIE
jgi:DNA-binding GntR family transcriptional regulator